MDELIGLFIVWIRVNLVENPRDNKMRRSGSGEEECRADLKVLIKEHHDFFALLSE